MLACLECACSGNPQDTLHACSRAAIQTQYYGHAGMRIHQSAWPMQALVEEVEGFAEAEPSEAVSPRFFGIQWQTMPTPKMFR